MGVGCQWQASDVDCRRGVLAATIAALLLATASASGQQPAPQTTFMGVALEPLSGIYLVLHDANVRDAPRTGGRRLVGVEENDTVEAFGKAPGTAWVAVRRNGENLGFMFAPLLLPLIDGALTNDIIGAHGLPDGQICSYGIHYVGKGAVHGAPFQTADYDVTWGCHDQGREFRFYSLMFITEAPFAMSQSQIHQISLEFPDVAADYDRVMATIVLYDRIKKQVRFDRVTMPELAAAAPAKMMPAENVRQALRGAAAIAMIAWNDEAWARLSGQSKGPAETPPEVEDGVKAP